MSAPEDVAGVVQTAADEFKKMMDTLAEIFEKLQATEKAGKAANVQEGLLKAITDLKDEIVSLKEKPGLLSPGKVDEMAAKGADLQEAVLNPGDWQTALPGAGVPKMADGPLGNLMKGGPPGLPGLPGSEEGVPGLPDVPGLEEGGPGLPSLDAGGPGVPGMDTGGAGGIAKMALSPAGGGPGDIAGLAAGAAGVGPKLVGEAVGFIKGEKGKWMRPEGGPVIGLKNAPPLPGKLGL